MNAKCIFRAAILTLILSMGATSEPLTFQNVSLSTLFEEIVRIPSSNSLKLHLPKTLFNAVVVSGRIPILHKNSVADIHNVQELYFRRNCIEKIETGAFRNLSVTSLVMIHNCMKTVEEGVFHDLTLKELQVSFTPLSKIRRGSFGNLSQLIVLTLNNNELDSIENGVFDNLTKLEIMDLSKNNLSELPQGIYKNLPNLRMLSLRNNNFVHIQKGVFDSSSLQHLDLAFNSISKMEEGFLQFLPSLTRIILSHNKLSQILKNIFKNHQNLQQVELNNNQISFIDPEAFDNMPNLANIMLTGNQLSKYDTRWFQNTPNIYRLFLDYNSLDEIPDLAFENVYNHKKQWIKLGSNKIKKVSPETFKGFKKINNLDLSHNEIDEWDQNFLESAQEVDFVNLLYNKIECPSGDFGQVFKANKTYLFGNPLSGDCSEKIQQWQKSNPEKTVCVESVTC